MTLFKGDCSDSVKSVTPNMECDDLMNMCFRVKADNYFSKKCQINRRVIASSLRKPCAMRLDLRTEQVGMVSHELIHLLF